jgi:hypothetical protein
MPKTITITLAPTTIIALKDLGYALYVMRAFDTTNAGGKPLVWVTTAQFFEQTTIEFEAEYQTYISSSQVVANGVVDVSTMAPVALGQTATFNPDGTITVTRGGTSAGVTLVNGGTTPYTTGLAAPANGNVPAAIFAEPLYGLAEDIVAPLDQCLLTFSTQGVAAGTLVATAMSQSLLVDVTGASQRAVTFDINTGWSAGGATWATSVPAGTGLTSVLVHEKPLGRR